MNTISNHHIYHPAYYCELSPKQLKKVEKIYGGLINFTDDCEFVFYKNHPFFMGDCMLIQDSYWHGYFDDTFFSRIVVRYIPENDGYIFGIQYA